MTDETSAPAGGKAIAVITPAADTGTELSISQAAKALASARHRPKEESATVEQLDADPVEQGELAQANPESPVVETAEGDEAIEPAKPAIDPPKSWTKDLHEHWATLDPVLQERIVARDREDQAAIKRAFNEAADERKAVKAEREAAEKARQQYEAQLPALMQSLQDAQQSAFADIRTVDDVTRLANEDPFRYLQWQAHQTKLQAVNAELERAKGQQTQKQQSEWAEHVQKENELAAELIPDLADKDKGPLLMKRAADRLAELGFKSDELNEYANGKQKLSIYDHRFQQLVADSLKLADIQKAPKAVAAKPVPPVQRPGTAKPQGSANSERIQTLTRQLNETGSLKVAQELRAAQQAAQRRAS
jgi:hypothetical protein